MHSLGSQYSLGKARAVPLFCAKGDKTRRGPLIMHQAGEERREEAWTI